MPNVTNAKQSEHITRPIAASIAVVIRENQVLLVRRANPPDVGRWGFPGGKAELGETIQACATRELLEETGIIGNAIRTFTAVDAFDHDEKGSLRRHFILVAVLCEWVSGKPAAGDDALEAKWFQLDELDEAGLALSLDVARVAWESAKLVQQLDCGERS